MIEATPTKVVGGQQHTPTSLESIHSSPDEILQPCLMGNIFRSCLTGSLSTTTSATTSIRNLSGNNLFVLPSTPTGGGGGSGEFPSPFSPIQIQAPSRLLICSSHSSDSDSASKAHDLSPLRLTLTSSPLDNTTTVSQQQQQQQDSCNKMPKLRILPLHREQAWEDLEDDLLIILGGRLHCLHEFEKLHSSGVRRSNFLRSLAYLCSKPDKRNNESIYFEHIFLIARYLSIGRAARESKLAVLRTLMVCLSPPEATWQTRDAVVEGTLQFLIQRRAEWEFLEHSETVLIWEIRAMCLNQIDRERLRVELVANTGDSAAIMISTGAKLLETGMARSVPLISDRIDMAGSHVRKCIKPDEYPLMMDRNAVVAMAYSDAAKRASESAREGTRLAVGSLRGVSRKGLTMVARQFEGNLSETLPPEGVEVIKAAGKVGMATLGAAAIVGEAMIETSRAVVRKTAGVTADVVRHKYGESAAQVVTDTGETAGNVLRTLGNVAMLEGKIIASSTTKAAGKTHVNGEFNRAKDSLRLLEDHALGMVRNSLQMVADENKQRIIATPSGVPSAQKGSVKGRVRVGQMASAGHAKIDGEDKDTIQGETKSGTTPSSSPCELLSVSANASAIAKEAKKDESSQESKSSTDAEIQKLPSETRPMTPLSQHTASTLPETEGSESSFEDTTSSIGRSSSDHSSVRIGRRGSRSQKKRVPLTPNNNMVLTKRSGNRSSLARRGSKQRGKLLPKDVVGKENPSRASNRHLNMPTLIFT